MKLKYDVTLPNSQKSKKRSSTNDILLKFLSSEKPLAELTYNQGEYRNAVSFYQVVYQTVKAKGYPIKVLQRAGRIFIKKEENRAE